MLVTYTKNSFSMMRLILSYLLCSQVLESIWLVVKSNMNLVITVLTSTLSLVFGGGTALLNFVISSVS